LFFRWPSALSYDRSITLDRVLLRIAFGIR
jgi:hypothetical protein